jgi:hypothetical protein
MAIGFKLTGIFILPLVCTTIVDKLRKRGIKNAIIGTISYIFIAIVVAAVCTAPAIILFPFFIKELGSTYTTFLLFKNMQNAETQISADLLLDSFAFYFSPVMLIAIFVLFGLLIFDDIKNKRYISLYIFGSITFAALLVICVTHKGPIYLASYFLSLSFFIPISLLGICTLSFVPSRLKAVLAYCLVVIGLFYGSAYRMTILEGYGFFAMAKTETVKRQMLALEEMRLLVYPLALPLSILQDSSSIFPATRFTRGVEVAINYGDLHEKSTWGDFDYILLNSNTYYGKRLIHIDANNTQLNNGQVADDLEEETRKTLRNTGDFYGRKYSLVYSGYDALLYKLDKK